MTLESGNECGVRVQMQSQSCILPRLGSAGQLCEGSHHEGVELGAPVCGRLASGAGGLAVSMWLLRFPRCERFNGLHPGRLFHLG